MTLYHEVLDSPIDPLLAIVSPDGLVALEFNGARRLAFARKRLSARIPGAVFAEAPLAYPDGLPRIEQRFVVC